MIKFLALFFVLLGLVIIQVSFLPVWPLPVKALNLVLTLLIFFTLILPYRQALGLAFSAGLMLELYSLSFFGLVTLSFLLTVELVYFLFKHFFTNRSLYAFVGLALAGSLSYNLIFYLGHFLFYFFGGPAGPQLFSPPYLFWQLGLNSLIFMIIFFVFQLTNRQFAGDTTFFK